MRESQQPEEKGPLPRTREAVDWWLNKWGRHAVVDDKEPLSWEDVQKLVAVNGGTAWGLELGNRNLREIDFFEAKLQGTILNRTDLRDAALMWAKLQEVDLTAADLRGTNLHGADLQGAKLAGAKLQGANLLEAQLQGADLVGAKLQGAYLWESNLQGAKLSLADLQDAELFKANLQGTDFAGAKLQGANLRNAQLQEAQLMRADLRGADLQHADLRRADLRVVRISADTILEGVEWDDGYESVLEQNGNYQAAIYLYRQLKEWHERAGFRGIAGEFHYREREAARKAERERLGQDFKEFKQTLVDAWRQFRGKSSSA